MCEVVLPATRRLDPTLVCRMTYKWQASSRGFSQPPRLGVSLRWTDGSGIIASTTANSSSYSGTVETNRTIDDTLPSTISSHSCSITFNFMPGTSPFFHYAVNPLSYTYTCQQNPDWRKCDFTHLIVINGVLFCPV